MKMDTKKPFKILYAEDEETCFRAMKTVLSHECQYKLTWAQNGAEALRNVRDELPDLILMDLKMPVMGGIEATRTIREEISKTVPIVVITALSKREVPEMCKGLGINDYLFKPYRTSDLMPTLDRYCHVKSA